MESSLKEQTVVQQSASHNNTRTAEKHNNDQLPCSELTQLELMTLWRDNLAHFLDTFEISGVTGIGPDKTQLLTPEIIDKIKYLSNTDELLRSSDEILLSSTGFEKYKNTHLAVITFLEELRRERKGDVEKNNFYFLSSKKYIEKKTKATLWRLTFFYLMILLFSIVSMFFLEYKLYEKTDGNNVILSLFIIKLFYIIKIIKLKVKKYKYTALNPIRFIIGLLSIYLMRVVFFGSVFIALPAIIIIESKPYWRDDVFIISSTLVSFIILWCFLIGKKQFDNSYITEIKSNEK